MSGQPRYRFRTGVLHGPWRDCPNHALRDAIDAGQVRSGKDGGIEWRVPGEIEAARVTKAVTRRRD